MTTPTSSRPPAESMTVSLPWSEDAERAVLGGIIIDAENILPQVTDVLRSSDFYHGSHRIIFSVILEMHTCGIPIDLVTLRDCLHSNGDDEKVGGAAYIASLTDGLARATNFAYYADLVKQKAKERRILSALKNAQTAYLSGEGRAESLSDLKATLEDVQPQPSTAIWTLYDSGVNDTWPQDPLVWLAEPIIPKGGIGFMSAPPKDRKSLLTLDLALHFAQLEPRLWLGKFKILPTKVLYIAREDPLRRVRERMIEICNSYQMPIPEPGRLQFLIRERIHLTEPLHLNWLKTTIQVNGFELLILDVINRMHPDLDEISAADMGKLVSILEELNRDLGVTILADDHTRKPQGKNTDRNSQEPNPFDMKGSIAKYGCADFMICLARTPQDNRMQIYCENKDSDERPMFFVDVSAKGSSDPKFKYAGDVTRLAGDMRAVGDANREKVFEALVTLGDWMSPKQVSQQLSMSDSTASKHLAGLFRAGRIDKKGNSRNIQYRCIFDQGEYASRVNQENFCYDND